MPLQAEAVATLFATNTTAPIELDLYDENDHQKGHVAIWRDGSVDDPTRDEIKRLFRCRKTHREAMIHHRTLAMLADVAERYPGKTIEYVSGVRLNRGESRTSPHRDARAIDFRIRGVQLREIRDYLWRTYTEVGVGWYPVGQFVHIDARPTMSDCAWTFLNGTNHYHPTWSYLARKPDPEEPFMQARRGAGS